MVDVIGGNLAYLAACIRFNNDPGQFAGYATDREWFLVSGHCGQCGEPHDLCHAHGYCADCECGYIPPPPPVIRDQMTFEEVMG